VSPRFDMLFLALHWRSPRHRDCRQGV